MRVTYLLSASARRGRGSADRLALARRVGRGMPSLPVVAFCLVMVATGCSPSGDQDRKSAGGSAATRPPSGRPARSPAPADNCLTSPTRSHLVHFAGSGGSVLTGLALGRGSLAVVLAHQSPGSLCQWWPYARHLATEGYRVLAFDFDGYGESTSGDSRYTQDVLDAARWIRGHGAHDVVLVGGSMGGAAVLTAAAQIDPAPAGVIAMSAPVTFGPMNALTNAPRLHAPLLFAVGAADGSFPEASRQLRAAAGSTSKRLVTVSDSTHGAALVDPLVGYPKIRAAVDTFMARLART